jgi:hypothetical protein
MSNNSVDKTMGLKSILDEKIVTQKSAGKNKKNANLSSRKSKAPVKI